MPLSTARRALADSALALLLACCATAAFLPPLASATGAAWWRSALAGLALVTTLLLHWTWLATGARRLGLRPTPWVALSVLLFPVGGAAALILLLGMPPGRAAPAMPAN